MPNYTRTGLKINGNRPYGVVKTNVKCVASNCYQHVEQ